MAFGERKPKFRSRKIDFNKSIAIYRWDHLNDLEELESPVRTVQPMATGVDKEEEDEQHLQAALSSQVTTRSERYYIPTPETKLIGEIYDKMYPAHCKLPKGMVKNLIPLEESFGSHGIYNAKEEDFKFLQTIAKPISHQSASTTTSTTTTHVKNLNEETISIDLLEKIFDCFEDAARQLSERVVTIDSLERLKWDSFQPNEFQLTKLLEYWRNRRTETNRSLLPYLRHEDSGKIGADPYVCFRRREIKLPRKTRRSDAQCIEKLKKLHYDLFTMKTLLLASYKRDVYKKESLLLETALFDQYWTIERWRRDNQLEWPTSIPPFKTAINCLIIEAKTNSNNHNNNTHQHHHLLTALGFGCLEKGPIVSNNKKQKTLHPSKARIGNATSTGTSGKPCKISIPVAALKTFNYAKSYYPIEMLRQMHKDMEQLLADDQFPNKDLTIDASDLSWDDEYFVQLAEQPATTAPTIPTTAATITNTTSTTANQQFIDRERTELYGRFRIGRGGRLLIDRKRKWPLQEEESFQSIQHDPHSTLAGLKLLGTRDMFHLHNSSVGNYNQHYIHISNQISKPLSFNAWLTATAPIVQAATSGVPSGGSGLSSGGVKARGGSRSPKKKKVNPQQTNSSISQTLKGTNNINNNNPIATTNPTATNPTVTPTAATTTTPPIVTTPAATANHSGGEVEGGAASISSNVSTPIKEKGTFTPQPTSLPDPSSRARVETEDGSMPSLGSHPLQTIPSSDPSSSTSATGVGGKPQITVKVKSRPNGKAPGLDGTPLGALNPSPERNDSISSGIGTVNMGLPSSNRKLTPPKGKGGPLVHTGGGGVNHLLGTSLPPSTNLNNPHHSHAASNQSGIGLVNTHNSTLGAPATTTLLRTSSRKNARFTPNGLAETSLVTGEIELSMGGLGSGIDPSGGGNNINNHNNSGGGGGGGNTSAAGNANTGRTLRQHR